MASKKPVRRTVCVSTSQGGRCDHCERSVGCFDSEGLAGSINHYISEHGYELMHVGQQTDHDQQGNPWQSTVAVLAHRFPPRVLEFSQVVIEQPVRTPVTGDGHGQ
jgi:hypothetical protein